LPTRLKYTVIKPIFKNGDRNDMSNYRPVSLLPSLFYGLQEGFICNNVLIFN
jgi:hypothetical protein